MAARGKSLSTGLGDLSLDTSSSGWPGEDDPAGVSSRVDDPWARFAEQLNWDELRLPTTAGEAELPLPYSESAPLDPIPPAEAGATPLPAKPLVAPPLPAKPLVAAPLPAKPLVAPPLPAKPLVAPPLPAKPTELVAAPLPAKGTTLVATPISTKAAARPPVTLAELPPPAPRPPHGPAAVSAPGPAAVSAVGPAATARPLSLELPTQPTRPTQSAGGSQAEWQARARELGLHSVFLAAADDFSSAQPPATAQELLATLAPPPARQVPSLAEVHGAPTVPVDAASAGALLPASTRLLSPPHQAGGLLGVVQRASTPPAVAAEPPVKELVKEPAPPPAPPPTRPGGSAVEAEQVVRQALQRGKELFRKLLRPSAESGPAADPSRTSRSD